MPRQSGTTGSNVLAHLDRLTEAGEMDAVAGFFEGAKYPDGTSVPQTMFFNEYGTRSAKGDKHIPPRRFMRRTSKNGRRKWIDLLHKLLVSGVEPKAAYRQVAAMMAGGIKENINNFKEPGNAPATIEKKGFDAPLRETKVALNAVSWDVVKRGKLKGVK